MIMKPNELKVNQLNIEAPINNTVKLSAVAAAAIHSNKMEISNILENNQESFSDFWNWQYNTFRLAKLLGVSNDKLWKEIFPEILAYLKVKKVNSNYENTVPLWGKVA